MLARCLFLCLIMLVACGGPNYYHSTRNHVRDHWVTVRKAKGLELQGVNGVIDEHNRKLQVSYTAFTLLEVETARKLVVDTVDGLVEQFNQSEEYREFLLEEPLTDESIELDIQADHFFGEFFGIVYLNHVSLNDGYIDYYDFNRDLVHSEPYERARAIVYYDREEMLRSARQGSGNSTFSGISTIEFESRSAIIETEDPEEEQVKPQTKVKSLPREEESSVSTNYWPKKDKEEEVSYKPERLFPEVTEEAWEEKKTPEYAEEKYPYDGYEQGPYKMGQ